MLFLGIMLCLAILMAAVYLLQNHLIYFPHSYSLAELVQAAAQHALVPWPSADEAYRGLVSRDAAGVRGSVVVFHGNAGSALGRLHYLAALEPLGFRVILAEYPGYGARPGQPGEQALVSDARALVELAARDSSGPLYVWGESLGCGVATAVAADPSLPVDGLALITPFTNLPDLAQSVYWYFPAKWIVRDRYDSVANLRDFRKPVAVLVAGSDEIIPFEQAEELYDSLAAPKRLWVFAGAGHNTWPASPQQAWWSEVASFLSGDQMPP